MWKKMGAPARAISVRDGEPLVEISDAR